MIRLISGSALLSWTGYDDSRMLARRLRPDYRRSWDKSSVRALRTKVFWLVRF